MTPTPAGATPVSERLHRTAVRLLRRVRHADRDTGLGPRRLSALSVIVHAGPLPVGRLARFEQVSVPTISRVVRALEQQGLIERLPDPSDGRVARLRATRAGRRLLERGRRGRVAALERDLAGLTPAEIGTLTRAVAILERRLEIDVG